MSGHRPWYAYDEGRGNNGDVKGAGDSCFSFAGVPCVFAHVVNRGTNGF